LPVPPGKSMLQPCSVTRRAGVVACVAVELPRMDPTPQPVAADPDPDAADPDAADPDDADSDASDPEDAVAADEGEAG